MLRNGYKVVDMDTHIGPSMEILEQYVEPSFRPRLKELDPYRRARTLLDGRTATSLGFAPIPFNRIAGQAPSDDDITAVAAGRNPLDGRVSGFRSEGQSRVGHHRVPVRALTQEDNSDGRIADMDDEGRDIDFMFTGPWVAGIRDNDAGRPYPGRRVVPRFPSVPGRFYRKVPRQVEKPCRDTWDGRRVGSHRAQGHSQREVAVRRVDTASRRQAYRPPGFRSMWDTMNDLDLPLVHHSFFTDYPYFPGYRDMWGNAAISRAAVHPWGAARLFSYLACSGLFDRFPNLRCAVAEVGHGWLPQWAIRLGEMLDYVKGTTPPLKYTPAEYIQQGRFLCGAEPMEGPKMTKACIDILGEDWLMHQSDYPHGESYFPDTAQMIIDWPIWEEFGEAALRKHMGGNAEKFLRII